MPLACSRIVLTFSRSAGQWAGGKAAEILREPESLAQTQSEPSLNPNPSSGSRRSGAFIAIKHLLLPKQSKSTKQKGKSKAATAKTTPHLTRSEARLIRVLRPGHDFHNDSTTIQQTIPQRANSKCIVYTSIAVVHSCSYMAIAICLECDNRRAPNKSPSADLVSGYYATNITNTTALVRPPMLLWKSIALLNLEWFSLCLIFQFLQHKA